MKERARLHPRRSRKELTFEKQPEARERRSYIEPT